MPRPIDPVAPPRWLRPAAALVLAVGTLLLLVGAKAAVHASNGLDPAIPPEAFLVAFVGSLPPSVALLVASAAVGRRRLRRYEARYGFLPRPGRTARPASGRTTLFRLEFGTRGKAVCLMLARWDLTHTGWQRRRVVEHEWAEADDAVGLGEARARLSAQAEQLEAEVDAARLAAAGERELADHAHALAEGMAADPRWAR